MKQNGEKLQLSRSHRFRVEIFHEASVTRCQKSFAIFDCRKRGTSFKKAMQIRDMQIYRDSFPCIHETCCQFNLQLYKIAFFKKVRRYFEFNLQLLLNRKRVTSLCFPQRLSGNLPCDDLMNNLLIIFSCKRRSSCPLMIKGSPFHRTKLGVHEECVF